MAVKKGYPRSTTRDFEVMEVKGATPRAYQTHPNLNSSGSQANRGTDTVQKIRLGSIPNKNPARK